MSVKDLSFPDSCQPHYSNADNEYRLCNSGNRKKIGDIPKSAFAKLIHNNRQSYYLDISIRNQFCNSIASELLDLKDIVDVAI